MIIILFSFCQSDESDESSEEESATDNGEKLLSDGKKKYIFVFQGNAKSEVAHTITSSKWGATLPARMCSNILLHPFLSNDALIWEIK